MARLFTLLFSTTLLLVSLNIIAAVKLANENFDEYRLANGMSVIFSNLFYDDGLVRIDWNIHAGSAQELNELEGVAHLLEHSLFSISEYDSLFDYFHSLGGSVSAFTSLNGTSYRFKVKPKDVNRALEVIGLWQNIQAFNEDEHLKNQDIVLNEIQLKFNQYQSLPAYHFQNSPLLRKTVGVARDINQVSMADLKQYYQHWYHPKNTELFISGLKADAATIKKVEVFLNNKWTTKPNLAKEATLNFKQSTWDIFESKNEYDSIHANYYLKTDNKKYLIDLVYTQLLDEYLKSYAKLLIKNSDYFHEFRTSVITYPNYVIRYNANIYVTKNYTDESIKTLDLIIENIINGKFDDSILESATQSLLKSSNISNNYTNYYESFRNFMDFESKKNRFKIKHDTLINLDKTKLSEIALKLVSEHYYGLIYSSEHKKRRSYNDINQYVKDAKAQNINDLNAFEDSPVTIAGSVNISKPKITPSKILKKALYSWELENGIKVQFVSNTNVKDELNKVYLRYVFDSDFSILDSSFWSAFKVWSALKIERMNAVLDAGKMDNTRRSLYTINHYSFSADIVNEKLPELGEIFYQFINQPVTDAQTIRSSNKTWFKYLRNEKSNQTCDFNEIKYKTLYKKRVTSPNGCYDEKDFTQLNALDINKISEQFINKNANPVLIITGALTLPEAKKWIEQYVAPIKTHDTTIETAKEISNKIKLPKSKTIEAGNHKGQDAIVSIVFTENKNATLKQIQIQSIMAGILKSMAFNDIREEQALAYSVSAFLVSKNSHTPLNEINIKYSTSLNNINHAESVAEDFIDTFFDNPINKQYFELSKLQLLNKIPDTKITKDIAHYLELANLYQMPLNDVLDLKSTIDSITLKDLEAYKQYLKEEGASLIFYQSKQY